MIDAAIGDLYKRAKFRWTDPSHPPSRVRKTVMANTRSAKKATRVAARRTIINKNRLSRVRSSVRKVEEAIAQGSRAQAEAALKDAEPELMRGAQRGVIHKNAASRKVARLAQRIKKLA